jgi:hypothetical protein
MYLGISMVLRAPPYYVGSVHASREERLAREQAQLPA